MLFIGEKVGRGRDGDAEIEIAVDPLEGTNLCATGAANSISVIAMGEKGKLLRAPDTYMEKIAVGPGAKGAIDLAKSPTQNLLRVSDALGKYVEDLTVVILDRPRHEKLIAEVRACGARIKLIGDGDVAGALSTCFPETGVDVLMGTGGAPEGVISAAAVRCVGGELQGRLAFRNEKERERALAMGIKDLEKIMSAEEMAGGNVMFAATGVTNGDFLKGVQFTGGGATSHSVIMRSKTGTVRYIEAVHHFKHKPDYGW
jgi:fructose-1,6-bisphosphatase II